MRSYLTWGRAWGRAPKAGEQMLFAQSRLFSCRRQVPGLYDAGLGRRLLHLRSQMLYHAKDEVAIVLVGTAETENSVVESLPGQGYEHIVELTKGFSPATLSTLKHLGRLPLTSAEADIVCGVVVATQLCAGAGIKRGAGRILVISDGGLVPAPGRDVLDAGIAEQLGSLGISVDIFAVGGWGKDADADGGSGGADSSASPRKPDASSLGFRPQLLELARATGGTVSF